MLVVEDDGDAREALKELLEHAGYGVLGAPNGAVALSLLRAASEGETPACDIVVLDLMMPIMNGWDFRSKQRADPGLAQIPVLLMSAGGHLGVVSGSGLDRIGRYELIELLGVGGMAEAYQARSTGPSGFQRTVVIKRIHPDYSDDPDFVSMFVAEARILGLLHHAVHIGQEAVPRRLPVFGAFQDDLLKPAGQAR